MMDGSAVGRGPAGRWAGAVLLLCAATVAVGQLALATGSQAASPAVPMPAATTSQYETGAGAATLFAQGAWAGRSGAQGLVILDFGRPAAEGSTLGTVTHANAFASLSAVATAVESYIDGYFQEAPNNLHLYVAVGTNNSCGTGQPCGRITCGCSLEPTSYSAWGAALASTVESVQAWASTLKQRWSYTDTVTVVAGDDIEPAYDPGYLNTYNLLAGYAAAVGGYQPAMIDYGSSEPGYWTQTQLLQVANGFKPDVVVPQLYFPAFVDEWASLVSFAKTRGQAVTIFGVLTDSTTGNTTSASYASMLNALSPITGQSSIRWASTIGLG
ncbi:MAG TPA: hypothetical protein VHB02_12360 [Acidimicrobiales bacterium]|nr:hypothetical protein [Acidimicrobiales bacterium]